MDSVMKSATKLDLTNSSFIDLIKTKQYRFPSQKGYYSYLLIVEQKIFGDFALKHCKNVEAEREETKWKLLIASSRQSLIIVDLTPSI
jgi:hypothetical protein